jgi:dTDP-4-amino-4,6-dideoxygalactose transaminase
MASIWRRRVLTKTVPINSPFYGEGELANIRQVLSSGKFTSAAFEGGEWVQKFEGMLAKFTGAKHAIAVNSGTAALQAALMSERVGPGDEVIIPSFTFAATANAVLAVGAKPVFADVDGIHIDWSEVKSKISIKTKAIIPVHLYGFPINGDDMEEAKKLGIPIIEDACQSLGSRYGKKHTGTFGKMGCFSFYAGKVLTTAGEGGAIVTDDDEAATQLRRIRNHGMERGYDTSVLGLNLRMLEINAAMGCAQMDCFEDMLSARRSNAVKLAGLLEHFPLGSHSNVLKQRKIAPNWYLYPIYTDERDALKAALQKEGVTSMVYYDPPVHRNPLYIKEGINLPHTDMISKCVLCLPVHPKMNDDDLKLISEVISRHYAAELRNNAPGK